MKQTKTSGRDGLVEIKPSWMSDEEPGFRPELKPCPFCGDDQPVFLGDVVCCSSCHCEVRWRTYYREVGGRVVEVMSRSAVDVWNMRAEP